MTTWRSPELEAVFGGPLAEAVAQPTTRRRLIDAGATEGDLLDFKAQLPRGDGGTRGDWTYQHEFAKDVAAMANYRGGALVYGIEETGGIASAETVLAGSSTEAEEQRLRTALVNRAAPLPETQFLWGGDSDSGWWLVVVVPPSQRAPHAVAEGPRGLSYPVRHGRDTRWLTESEVAERYQLRIGGLAAAEARVSRVVREAEAALSDGGALWLFGAVVPQHRVEEQLDRRTLNVVSDWHHHRAATSPTGDHLLATGVGIPAPGRVTFTVASYDAEEVLPRDAYVELHLDGSAVVATEVAQRGGSDGSNDVGEVTLIDDMVLILDEALSWAAERSGAWGSATVVAGLTRGVYGSTDPVRITSWAGASRGTPVRGSRALVVPPRVTTVADLSAVDTMQGRLAVCHSALCRLLHCFGIAEPRELSRDGELLAAGLPNAHRSAMRAWADAYEVPIV